MRFPYIDEDKYSAMIGVYLRERREDLELSVTTLSKSLKMRADHLRRIEAGEVLPRQETLAKLKEALKLNDEHLAKIEEVAKMAFIDNLISAINSSQEGR